VLVERAIMATFGDTSAGTVHIFQGRVSTAKPSRTEVALTINSDIELLNIQIPRNTYQPGCRHTLFDGGCTLSKAAYAVSGTVNSGSSVSAILSSLSQATDYFTLGTITFTSGANAGTSRTIKWFGGGSFALTQPLLFAPVAGDTFTAYPGCDKQMTTCASKYGNKANFGGTPYVPQAERAI
jgi:uncharacterized phage protein (TIGR02218 family)